jgi:hypothetical protein
MGSTSTRAPRLSGHSVICPSTLLPKLVPWYARLPIHLLILGRIDMVNSVHQQSSTRHSKSTSILRRFPRSAKMVGLKYQSVVRRSSTEVSADSVHGGRESWGMYWQRRPGDYSLGSSPKGHVQWVASEWMGRVVYLRKERRGSRMSCDDLEVIASIQCLQ